MCLASVADHSRALARVSVFGFAEEWQLWAGAAGRQEGQIPGKINKRVKHQKGARLLFSSAQQQLQYRSCAVSHPTLSFVFASEVA